MCLSNEIVTLIYSKYKNSHCYTWCTFLAKKGDALRYANEYVLVFSKSVIKFACDIVHSKLGY